jgi:hypothetical protein
VKALRSIGPALLVFCICQLSTGKERSAEQWQKLIDKEEPVAYKPEAGSILGSLVGLDHYGNVDILVHMIYDPKLWYGRRLTIKFVRNDTDVLVLKGHLNSVWVNDLHALYFADFDPIQSGCAVVAYDLGTGKESWRTELQGIGLVDHSKYRNSVNLELADGAVCVRGYESFGNYVEILDANTGKMVAHRVFKPRPMKACVAKQNVAKRSAAGTNRNFPMCSPTASATSASPFPGSTVQAGQHAGRRPSRSSSEVRKFQGTATLQPTLFFGPTGQGFNERLARWAARIVLGTSVPRAAPSLVEPTPLRGPQAGTRRPSLGCCDRRPAV